MILTCEKACFSFVNVTIHIGKQWVCTLHCHVHVFVARCVTCHSDSQYTQRLGDFQIFPYVLIELFPILDELGCSRHLSCSKESGIRHDSYSLSTQSPITVSYSVPRDLILYSGFSHHCSRKSNDTVKEVCSWKFGTKDAEILIANQASLSNLVIRLLLMLYTLLCTHVVSSCGG